MSRIHEALKKAASERAAQLDSKAAVDPAEFAGDNLIDDALEQHIPRQAGKAAVEVAEPESNWDRLIQQCRRVDWKIDPRFSVFADQTIFRHGAEKFRTLRSRLYQVAAARPLKRVLLTSSIPEEGKTFVCSNLAQSFARQENRKVLLIDADLRASRLHLAMGAPGTPGLADYLSGQATETQIIQVSNNGNLCFIPGGNPVSNASELLLADRMKALLDDMTPLFDWIVLDSPPAMAVHDASVLADLCDGVLFVVRAGSTDHEVAQRATNEFRPESLLGVVLNRVDKDEAYGEYYYGYSEEEHKHRRA
jgi:protein-tyrosine kinase